MSKSQKRNLLRIIIAAVLFVIIMLFCNKCPIKALLYLAPYFIVGADVLWDAVRNIVSGRVFDENFLMALATVGAFAIGEYPEAVFVMLFFQIGELFQSVAVGKSRRSITQLMDIAPQRAMILKDGEFTEQTPDDVKIGDILMVKPGEKIPVDAVVLKGESDIDTSNMTGESIPRFVKAGDSVISGCVNLSGAIEIEAVREYCNSTVAKTLELVENSAMNKGKYENFITRFAHVYTPVVVLLALGVAFIPPIFSGELKVWVLRALSFLVVSCPCALVISVPLSFFGGIGAASKKGILVKGSNYLEAMAKCKAVVTDKTGTLTEGKLFVKDVKGDSETLKIAASLEKYSNHPIGRAIVKACEDVYTAEDIAQIPGLGIKGTINKAEALVGNRQFLEKNGIKTNAADDMVHVAYDGKYLGGVVVEDKVRSNAKEAVSTLKSLGIKDVIILTGDGREKAESIAKQTGIDKYFCSLLPSEKVGKLEKIMDKNKCVTAYLGDGINDAPVLKRADVGIAMGEFGSDAAIESSDIVFMRDDLMLIPECVRIAKKTLTIVRENIVFSIAVKVLVLILTALGYAHMWQAVFADVGVMVIAVLNTLRTLKI